MIIDCCVCENESDTKIRQSTLRLSFNIPATEGAKAQVGKLWPMSRIQHIGAF